MPEMMKPQAAPMPPQQGQAPQGGGDAIGELAQNLVQGIGVLAQLVGKSGNQQGASELAEMMQGIQRILAGESEEDAMPKGPVAAPASMDMMTGGKAVKPAL